MNCEVGSAGPFQGKRSNDENHYCVAYKPVYIFCIHYEVSSWEDLPVVSEKCPKFIHKTHAIHFAETCFLFLLINPTTSLLSRIIIMVMYVHILGPDFNILTKI